MVSTSVDKLGFASTDTSPDLEIALNYGQATGAAPLLRFVTEHTEVSGIRIWKPCIADK